MKPTSNQAINNRSNALVVHWFRIIFLLGIWLFIACLLIQVLMVGLAVFIRPSWWAMHVLFAHTIGFLALMLLVIVFLGRFPRMIWAFTGLIVFLVSMQYNTIHLSHLPGLSLAAAFHPVNALLLFWVATTIARKTWQVVTSQTAAITADEMAIEYGKH